MRQIREIKNVSNDDFEMFKKFLELSKKNINNWNTNSEFQNIKIAQLKEDIQKFEKFSVI